MDSLPEPDFTEQEVDEAVRNLDVNKCPGPDGIDGNIVKKNAQVPTAVLVGPI